MEISDHVADEADRLISEGRVRLTTGPTAGGRSTFGAIVLGRHGDYAVWFDELGSQCDCRAGADHGWTEPRCSHVVAAMCCWADALEGRPWHSNGWLG